jgi:hypothetical protein
MTAAPDRLSAHHRGAPALVGHRRLGRRDTGGGGDRLDGASAVTARSAGTA